MKITTRLMGLCCITMLGACGPAGKAPKNDIEWSYTICIGELDNEEFIRIRRYENDVCHRVDMVRRAEAVIGKNDGGWTAIRGGIGDTACDTGRGGEKDRQLTYVERPIVDAEAKKTQPPMVDVRGDASTTLVGTDIYLNLWAYYQTDYEVQNHLGAQLREFVNMKWDEVPDCNY